jgi:hypothetical protein
VGGPTGGHCSVAHWKECLTKRGGPTGGHCSVAHWKEYMTESGDLLGGSVLLDTGRNV